MEKKQQTSPVKTGSAFNQFSVEMVCMPNFFKVRELLPIIKDDTRKDLETLIANKVNTLNTTAKPIAIERKVAVAEITQLECDDQLTELKNAEVIFDLEPESYELKKELVYFKQRTLWAEKIKWPVATKMQLGKNAPPDLQDKIIFSTNLGISALHAVVTSGAPIEWRELGHYTQVVFSGTILKDSKGYFNLGLRIADCYGCGVVSKVTRHEAFYVGSEKLIDTYTAYMLQP